MMKGSRAFASAGRRGVSLPACRRFSGSAVHRADFAHVVIGGGVVGLAAARALAERAARSSSASSSASTSASSVLVLERHAAVGTETSSRNSEVIHAGLYYAPDSLKMRMCLRGRQLLYDFCPQHGVAHRRTGKWLVAQTAGQREALQRMAARVAETGKTGTSVSVPLRWVPPEEARQREPAVRAEAGVLESLETGIVDSHGLMAALQGLLEQAGGEVALGSRVVGVRPLGRGSGGWELDVQSHADEAPLTITAETIVNAAGLGAAAIHNMISSSASPSAAPLQLYYAKGNYFSYSASHPRVSTLIYPVPEPGLAGLGTHLTLDLSGRMRFGPDVEWVDDPTDLTVRGTDRIAQALEAIRMYLPDVEAAALQPDYAGIRPKLVPPGSPAAADFVIRREPGYTGWINLLGIESPGLTSSLAIGEMVRELLYD